MTTPLLGITELQANQSQPEVTVNTAFRALEALQFRALSKTVAAEPVAPSEADVYILPASPTGANWATFFENQVVRYTGGAWIALTPFEGINLWVNDEDLPFVFNGTAWATITQTPADLQAVTDVGATTTNVIDAAGLEFGTLKGTGATTVTDILDEGTMVSDSPTALATQQSIKTYVDSQVGSADTLSEVLALGNTTGGTDISVTTGDDIAFADNAKATFGAGNDLQIYHTGSVSLIKDAGDGGLYLGGSDLISLGSSDFTETYALFNDDGAVILRHDNATKFATTNGGIDVTGQTTTDALLVQTGAITATTSSSTDFLTIQQGGTQAIITADSPDGAANMMFRTTAGGVDQDTMKLLSGGDVIFYDAAGVNAKFRWDASAESLTVTGKVASDQLDVNGTVTLEATTPLIYFMETDITDVNSRVRNAGGSFQISTANDAKNSFKTRMNIDNTTGDVSFYEDTGTTVKMTWDASAEQLQLTGAGGIEINSELSLKHNGSASVVDGGDALRLRALNDIKIQNFNSTETMAAFVPDGAATLYYDDAAKIATTSTGIDVTGTATMDGIVINRSGVQSRGIEWNRTGTIDAAITLDETEWLHYDNYFGNGHRFRTGAIGAEVDRMTIEPTGDVGIGIINPDNKLAVIETGAASPTDLTTSGDYAALFGSSTTSAAGVTQGIMLSGGGTNNRGVALLAEIQSTGNNTDFIIATSNASSFPSEKMRVLDTGQVGIGTSSPSSTLDVAGTVTMGSAFVKQAYDGITRLHVQNYDSGVSASAQMYLEANGNNFYVTTHGDGTATPNLTEFKSTAGGSAFAFSTYNTEAMRITSAGKVGIGESNPDEALVVRGGGYASNQNSGIAIQSGDASGSHWKSAFKIKSDNGGIQRTAIDVSSSTAGDTVEAMSFIKTGYVGVGTTDPATLLDIASDTPTLSVTNTKFTVADGDEYGSLDFVSEDGSFTKKPVARVQAVNLGGAGSYSALAFHTSSGTSAAHTAERMRIDKDGNVLIGTTVSPAGSEQVVAVGGVYLGGTAAANKLDDYEEGTWTPTVIGATSGSATITTMTQNNYTKVGNVVTASVYIGSVTMAGLVGDIQIGGLPFTSNGFHAITPLSNGNIFTFDMADYAVGGFTQVSTNRIQLRRGSSRTTITGSDITGDARGFMLNITYKTDS